MGHGRLLRNFVFRWAKSGPYSGGSDDPLPRNINGPRRIVRCVVIILYFSDVPIAFKSSSGTTQAVSHALYRAYTLSLKTTTILTGNCYSSCVRGNKHGELAHLDKSRQLKLYR